MSRQELAEAVNAYVWQRHCRQEHLDHTDIGKLERGRIRWPGEQRREALRVVLGVASDSEIGLYLNRRPASGGQPDILVDRLDAAGDEGDEVNRRELLAAGGATAAGVVLPARASTGRLAGVVAALTGRAVGQDGEHVEDLPLVEAAARVKRQYQAGRYRQVLDGLPGMLAVARTADEEGVGESRLDVAIADAYQTTCSVLLKLGEVGLALLAADRSVAAAHRSGDPVAIGASSRALAHALASNGHPGRAVTVALAAARQLERASGLSTAPALAVYGALLLRAATLAADFGGLHQHRL